MTTSPSFRRGRASGRSVGERLRELEALNDELRRRITELEARAQGAQSLAVRHEERAAELEAANRKLADALRETERALEIARKSAAHYRLLLDANPLPAWVYDRDTLRFLAVNQSAVRVYGYTEEEFLSLTLADIRPPEDVQALRVAVAASGEGPYHGYGWRHRLKDGTVRDVEIVSQGIEFDGHRNADLVIVIDVTDRLRAEAKLRDQTDVLRAVVDDSPLGVVVLDLDLRIS